MAQTTLKLDKDVPFRVSLTLLLLKVKSRKSPIFGPHFQRKHKILNRSYYRNSQILYNKKNRQILYAGGPNTPSTNPRWRTAAILKKINKLPYLSNGLTNLHEIQQNYAQLFCPCVRPLKVPNYTRKLCYRKDDHAMRLMYECPESF